MNINYNHITQRFFNAYHLADAKLTETDEFWQATFPGYDLAEVESAWLAYCALQSAEADLYPNIPEFGENDYYDGLCTEYGRALHDMVTLRHD